MLWLTLGLPIAAVLGFLAYAAHAIHKIGRATKNEDFTIQPETARFWLSGRWMEADGQFTPPSS